MKHFPLITTGLVLICSLMFSHNLYSFITWEQLYPKVLGKFNSLPGKTQQHGVPGESGGFEPMGGFIESDPTCYYEWNGDCVKFLRKFDILLVRNAHTMTYDETYDDTVPSLVGNSINHYYFLEDEDHRYDHDHHSSGSLQESLGKSKGGLLMMDWNQEIISTYDLVNINENHFTAHEDNAKRELVDWLSPGWFALGVGGTVDTLQYPGNDSTWILLEEADSISNFINSCWGNSYYPCGGESENTTYVMILPLWEDLGGMLLEDCKGNPPYEIMQVTAINQQIGALMAHRGEFGTPRLNYTRGQEIRPMIWTNPNNWGDKAFFTNPTTVAPTAYVEGYGPYQFYQMGALFVANHYLKATMTLDYEDPDPDTTFYLPDGIRLDGYQPGGPANMGNRKMYLHSEVIDLDLDGIPDCKGGDPDSCETSIVDAWNEGYEEFLRLVRDSTESIRGDSTAFIIVSNGHPDTTHYKFLNGRFFEDTNGWFHDSGWIEVITRSQEYEEDPRIVDPRRLHYCERDFTIPADSTNLAMMRLTLAVSLIAADNGAFGVIGGGPQGAPGRRNTRSPLFHNVEIEDYYDEYAVDYWGRGCRHPDFPRDDEGYLLNDAKYYLGEPVGTVKQYPTDIDMIYREFDHGVVIAHLGYNVMCEIVDVIIDSLELNEPPTDSCHLMRIFGIFEVVGNDTIFDTRYNDNWKNTGLHGEESIRVDPLFDNDYYGRGDAIILLKEGDGFFVHEGCNCGN